MTNKLKSWKEEVEKEIRRTRIFFKGDRYLYRRATIELATIKKATQIFEEMMIDYLKKLNDPTLNEVQMRAMIVTKLNKLKEARG